MCAIIDANVSHEVFGSSRPEAGKEFFAWIHDGSGFLVAGGRLLDELYSTQAREWARQAALSGRMKIVNSTDISVKERELLDQHVLRSDDPHVIALAQVSGARLLYSNDRALQQDFADKQLVDDPRGKVYTTRIHKNFSDTHRGLLARRDLCRHKW